MKLVRTFMLAALALGCLATSALAQDRTKDRDKDKEEREAREARPSHEVFGIDLHPFAALVLSRPSGPDDWSTGFEAGVEFDIHPIWLGVQYTLHDILTEDTGEVYPFDGSLDIKLGVYF